ncbi:hypothetical protein Leryth_006430 [Lithospermum erythrorhizon]|nr:hypothetical protein Leryth_006430 [Lithospermum erythrorhizon]
MTVTAGSLQLFPGVGVCKNQLPTNQPQNTVGAFRLEFFGGNLSSVALRQSLYSTHLSRRLHGKVYTDPYRKKALRCQSFLSPGDALDASFLKNTATTLLRSYHTLQNNQYVLKLVPAVGIVVFAVWGVGPLLRQIRKLFHRNDSNWQKSSTYYVMTSYIQPLLLWTGAILLCRTVDPVVLPTEASQAVKTRLLNFVRSLSTVLAFAYCLSSVIHHAQKFVTETNDPTDPRNMGFQFAGKAVYSAVWVAAASLFMELLGFSAQKWLTAGGLGTVLITLSGREILTNFLSSAIIHATRPFVLNEWIQTKIEGYEVSGTVEHVGWWSATVIRGEDREAVYIPNHKFTVNVVRNLTQKTHWRIKTHLAISHLDVSKINNIVADMRKVLAKNPQVEQQRLHRRVFLENINPENQALLILISCFVKTAHFEEYLCVKEGILLDLLRVIRHHRARLATPLRTIHKMHIDAELENVPFGDSIFGNGATSNRPLLLIEPPNKTKGEDKTKSRPARQKSEDDSKGGNSAADPKPKEAAVLNNAKDMSLQDLRADGKVDQSPDVNITEANNAAAKPSSDLKDSQQTRKPSSNISKANLNDVDASGSVSEVLTSNLYSNSTTIKQPKKVVPVGTAVDLSVSSSEHPGEKPLPLSSNMQSNSEGGRVSVSQSPVSKSNMEENIVLGVALEGSKRTLPIEDNTASPESLSGEKQLAMSWSGNGSAISEKDKEKVKESETPITTTDDQRNQQE